MTSTKRVKNIDELSSNFDNAARAEAEATAKLEALVASHKELVAMIKPKLNNKEITANEALAILRPSTQAVEAANMEYEKTVKAQEKAYKAYMSAAGASYRI